MVSSVMAVPAASRVKREDRRPSYSSDSGKKSSSSLFARILEETAREQEAAPRDCRTTLYDRDSRLRTFEYLSREYHY